MIMIYRYFDLISAPPPSESVNLLRLLLLRSSLVISCAAQGVVPAAWLPGLERSGPTLARVWPHARSCMVVRLAILSGASQREPADDRMQLSALRAAGTAPRRCVLRVSAHPEDG
jgi:hypothetical protein